jgi:hypothetical protein
MKNNEWYIIEIYHYLLSSDIPPSGYYMIDNGIIIDSTLW